MKLTTTSEYSSVNSLLALGLVVKKSNSHRELEPNPANTFTQLDKFEEKHGRLPAEVRGELYYAVAEKMANEKRKQRLEKYIKATSFKYDQQNSLIVHLIKNGILAPVDNDGQILTMLDFKGDFTFSHPEVEKIDTFVFSPVNSMGENMYSLGFNVIRNFFFSNGDKPLSKETEQFISDLHSKLECVRDIWNAEI